VLASTTAPMLALTKDVPGLHLYYATDDFVEAASLWGVSKRYLSAAREQNLRAADLVMAVTEELARHLQRGPATPRWLPNGADLDRFRDIETVPPADVPLSGPIAGVVGQFNARTDLRFLEAVQRAGVSLLLVGPRWFVTASENEDFDRLTNLPGVHWVDELPRDRLAPFLRVLDVGLTPYRDSMFNRRSYPLKTVEYLAAGVPVVTTDVASLNGLDERFVTAAVDTGAFGSLVEHVASAARNPTDIRRSVTTDDWDSRAARLLGWLGGTTGGAAQSLRSATSLPDHA
jgi:glycosyltransferase involved in cell wall biosynthesis